MKLKAFIRLTLLLGACGHNETNGSPPKVTINPPYEGTIFLDPDIFTANDPSSFQELTPNGQAPRRMYDRRVNNWITVEAYLALINYDDGLSTEVQVNPEFGISTLAQAETEKYAIVIGRLPTSLRKDVQTVWIHKGDNLFGGGNNNILIHVGQAGLYENDGILEEALVREAAHTSLDGTYANSPSWLDVQQEDPAFISSYARDNPTREDIAETFLVYLAVRHRTDRITENLKQSITNTIPNRIKYLDNQTWSLHPLR